MNFVKALAVVNAVFAKYKEDHPKWWQHIDGTPIINDISARTADAFRDAIMAEQERPSLEGYVLAHQTAVEFPDGKKRLGYTLLDGWGIFDSEQEVSNVIQSLSLPLGWVSIHTSQLLSSQMCPPTANTDLLAEQPPPAKRIK